MPGLMDTEWLVPREEDDTALWQFLRPRVPDRSGQAIKRLVTTAKVFINGKCCLKPGERVAFGQRVALHMSAPRIRTKPEARLVFEDAHLVVIEKPAGVSSVPYEERETGTAMDLIRDAWRRKGKAAPTGIALHVVHRIDKETSGLIVFAKSKPAERALAMQFREHTVERLYLCVAHGDVRSQTIESKLVTDHGDGLRGSTRNPNEGKRAVTHVKTKKTLRGATFCEVKLETGKTHQIRIHLAERSHPLVGEKVYIRDYVFRGGVPLESPRLLLHAATLGFKHPITGEMLAFESTLPPDFVQVMERL